jgi:photosystem II stability/assembly factor-like uncharacterized protein
MRRVKRILRILISNNLLRLKTGLLFCAVLVFMALPAYAGINKWTSNGPEGSSVSLLAISPNYATDATVFAVVPYARLYKSTNGGQSWTRTEAKEVVYTFCVAISPNYATDAAILAGTPSGVYKSTDGGQNWVPFGLNNSYVSTIAISPNWGANYKTAFVGSWDYDQNGFPQGHLYTRSTNGAWIERSIDRTIGGVKSFAVSPNYATDATVFSIIDGGLYKSTDRGVNWTEVSNGLPEYGFETIVFSPNYATDATVFAGGTQYGLYKSTDGGVNWTEIYGSVNTIAISPNYATDATVFAGTYLGIYKSTDGGLNWVEMNNGISCSVSPIAISPNYVSDSTIFAGVTGVNGYVYKSTDGGQSLIPIYGPITDLQSMAISPDYANDNTVFVGAWSFIYKSIDKGQSWTQIYGPAYRHFYSIAISPNYANDSTVFAGSGGSTDCVYKSTDGGQSWTQVIDSPGNGVSSIAISPNYANDSTVFATAGYGFYQSTDGGQSWTQITNGVSGSLSISPNYTNDFTIFAGAYEGVYKSTDGGQSWMRIFSHKYTNFQSIAISPNYASDSTIFAGTTYSGPIRSGVYKSTDGGQSWTQMNNGLPDTPTESVVAISPNYSADATVFTGIYGGLFTYTINEITPIFRCNFVPDTTAIQRGETLGFQATVANNTSVDRTAFVASKVRKPGEYGAMTGFIIGPYSHLFEPYQSKFWHMSHTIPLTAPLGTYTYHGYVGNYGEGNYAECTFDFEVVE